MGVKADFLVLFERERERERERVKADFLVLFALFTDCLA